MRTEPRSPLTSVVGGIRDRTTGVFRRLGERGPVVRVMLAVVVLGAVGAAGYFATLGDASVDYHRLYPNHRLSAAEFDAITKALDADGIEHVQMNGGGIGVRISQRSAAMAALDKRKFAPASLQELRKEALQTSVFEGPDERETKARELLERELQLTIEDFAGVREAHVRINRAKGRGGLRSAASVSAFVRVVREPDRELQSKTQMSIKALLDGNVPDLQGAVTLMDETGRVYLTAGNPSHDATMLTHAREEDYHDRIAEQLHYIRGLGVTVKIEKVTLPLPEVAPAPAPVQLRPIAASEPPPAPPAEEVRVNQPLEDPDLAPRPAPAPIAAAPAPAPAVAQTPQPVNPAPAPPPTAEKAKVWVRVPKSYYLNAYQVQNPNKGPSQADLVPIVSRTHELIKKAVNLVVPEKELEDVVIDAIPDDTEPSRVVRIPAAVPAWQTWSWGIAFGAIGAVAVMSLAAGFHRLATRKPAPRPSRSAWRDNYAVDEPETGTPAPSERVRELVRQNPEAAAGVLHRWIGQGGPNG